MIIIALIMKLIFIKILLEISNKLPMPAFLYQLLVLRYEM